MYKLRQDIKDLINSDSELQGKLAKQAKKSVQTILRWIKEDDEKITMLSLLNIVREHARLPKRDSLLLEA